MLWHIVDRVLKKLVFLGGFKFTLKPPYSIRHDNL